MLLYHFDYLHIKTIHPETLIIFKFPGITNYHKKTG
jgi:hypothetical protein